MLDRCNPAQVAAASVALFDVATSPGVLNRKQLLVVLNKSEAVEPPSPLRPLSLDELQASMRLQDLIQSAQPHPLLFEVSCKTKTGVAELVKACLALARDKAAAASKKK